MVLQGEGSRKYFVISALPLICIDFCLADLCVIGFQGPRTCRQYRNQNSLQNFERLDLGIQCSGITGIDPIDSIVNPPKHWVTATTFGGSMIHYDLPESAEVNIEVFTILGQRVANWQPGHQSAGQHQVEFSPATHHVPSGQYFYKIQAGKQQMSGGVQVVR